MTRPTTAQLNAAYDQFNFWYDKAKKLDEELAKAEERIAELESRTVKLPKKNIGWDRDEGDCWNNAIDACTEALTAAGIKVEAE
ncbi:hypothetical protein ACUIG4_04945 [Raoultella ornithinolytica]|uniref:hypothetical protein n=1 Tax=Raoultella ornithinolytica TaxID=54291 RepID=UPI00403DE01B